MANTSYSKQSQSKSRSQSRNVQASNYNFSEAYGTHPDLMQRSRFDRSSTLSTAFNVGDLVPVYVDEILPNDTVDMECNFAMRMQTLGVVPYDNLELSLYWFYVPNRLVWDGWKQFCGESKSAWLDDTPLTVPQLSCPAQTDANALLGTCWDYMGLPTPIKTDTAYSARVNALPFRAYGKIYNDWFRDVNYDAEALVDYTNNDTTYDADDPVKGGKLFKANKLHDYFTSALPQPQRGDDTNLLEGLKTALLNVTTTNDPMSVASAEYPIRWVDKDGKSLGTSGTAYNVMMGVTGSGPDNGQLADGPYLGTQTQNQANAKALVPLNLVVDLSDKGPNGQSGFLDAFSVYNLRQTIARQQIAEVSARIGNRYENFLLGFFGVEGSDIETGRSELLGVQKTTIHIAEVVQTSGNMDGSTPQGNIAGRSLTNIDEPKAFTKSFIEHGWIICLATARYQHSYCQGINKSWLRQTLDDYYMPQLAEAGDVPVYKAELYADGSTLTTQLYSDMPVWGYQEYGADYKYKPNSVTGAMRPTIKGGLSPWTWADYYTTAPTASAEWLKEDSSNVDRSLVIEGSDLVPQLYGNFYYRNYHTRMMPIKAVPGLERI